MHNKGAAGVDEMTVEELTPYLKTEWPKIKEQLLEDRYKLQPFRRVEIPKPGGKGTRLLGIPVVVLIGCTCILPTGWPANMPTRWC